MDVKAWGRIHRCQLFWLDKAGKIPVGGGVWSEDRKPTVMLTSGTTVTLPQMPNVANLVANSETTTSTIYATLYDGSARKVGRMKGCKSQLQGISKPSHSVQTAYATRSQIRYHGK